MDMVTLPVEQVKALLDVATNSMDFGSGFLDTAEVITIRTIAEAIGVDPLEVTPTNFRGQFAHTYQAGGQRWDYSARRTRYDDPAIETAERILHGRPLPDPVLVPCCARCQKDEAAPVHHGVTDIGEPHD